MAGGWDGSGNFTRAFKWVDERDAGNNIDAPDFDEENDAFAAGINACIAKNGENTATGDLPMGGNIHTGVGDATALTHYAAAGQVQKNVLCSGGLSGGSANAQTITLAPVPIALSLGMTVTFTAQFTNTGACTLDVNGLGADNIQRHGSNLAGGEIISGRTYTMVADGGIGTTWRMINDIQMGCQVVRSANQAVAHGATGEIAWDVEQYDPDSMITVTSTDIALKVNGLWLLTCNMTISSATFNTLSRAWFDDSLSNEWGKIWFGADGETNFSVMTVVPVLAIDTTASLRYYNNSGSSQNVTGRMSAVFVR
jgi:hypothetical protein